MIEAGKRLIVKMPSTTMSYEEKAEWLELLREKLRRQHNEMGRKFRERQISEVEWEKYKANVFGPRNTAISEAILAHRALKKQAVRALSDDHAKMTAISLPDCFEEVVSVGT